MDTKESCAAESALRVESFYGNEQYYVMEILIRLLSMASLDYRVSPLFRSINLLNNVNDDIFT